MEQQAGGRVVEAGPTSRDAQRGAGGVGEVGSEDIPAGIGDEATSRYGTVRHSAWYSSLARWSQLLRDWEHD